MDRARTRTSPSRGCGTGCSIELNTSGPPAARASTACIDTCRPRPKLDRFLTRERDRSMTETAELACVWRNRLQVVTRDVGRSRQVPPFGLVLESARAAAVKFQMTP